MVNNSGSNFFEQAEQRAKDKKYQKEKSSEITWFGSYLPEYKQAVMMPSFVSNVAKVLDGVEGYEKEKIINAFEKIRTGEYMDKEEETLLWAFTEDGKVNRFVKYNIEDKLNNLIRHHEMHCKNLQSIIDQDEKDANMINEKIGEVTELSHSPFEYMQFKDLLDETDSRHYFQSLADKHEFESFTSEEVNNFKIADKHNIMRQKKHYAAKRLKYHQDLVNCLRNITTKPNQTHTQNFDPETAGSLFTLRRLINLHQATLEMKQWQEEHGRKSGNLKIINESNGSVRVERK